jgi:hypothetical protein
VPADATVLRINRDVDVRAGEAVTMIGFPASVGAPWAVTKGSIVGRRGKDIVFAGAVEEGNSGGPLIKDDQVVGLITQAQGQFAFATPSLIVQYALESWGVRFAVRLRSTPTILHERELLPLFREKGFNHPGKGVHAFFGDTPRETMESLFGRFAHDFEPRTLEGVRVVVDRATGLMWQQKGSDVPTGADVPGASDIAGAIAAALDKLNSARHAGFVDWRLPTIEELASLIDARARVPNPKTGGQRFLDDAFDYFLCFSNDDVVPEGGNRTWLGVDFQEGNLFVGKPYLYMTAGACAVRSMNVDELRPPSPTPAPSR